MPRLENFSDRVEINGNPYPKDTLNYQVSGDNISLYFSNDRDRRILEGTMAAYYNWMDGGELTFSSLLQLQAALNEALFTTNLSSNVARAGKEQLAVFDADVYCILGKILKEIERTNELLE